MSCVSFSVLANANMRILSIKTTKVILKYPIY